MAKRKIQKESIESLPSAEGVATLGMGGGPLSRAITQSKADFRNSNDVVNTPLLLLFW